VKQHCCLSFAAEISNGLQALRALAFALLAETTTIQFWKKFNTNTASLFEQQPQKHYCTSVNLSKEAAAINGSTLTTSRH